MTAENQEPNFDGAVAEPELEQATTVPEFVAPLSSCATESIALAESICRDSGHGNTLDHQLLLSLASVPGSASSELLAELGVTPDMILENVQFLDPEPGTTTSNGSVSPSPRVTRVIDSAFAEAAAKRHQSVSTLHLLQGLVNERQGVAAFLIESPGFGLEKVRNAIIKAFQEGRTDRS